MSAYIDSPDIEALTLVYFTRIPAFENGPLSHLVAIRKLPDSLITFTSNEYSDPSLFSISYKRYDKDGRTLSKKVFLSSKQGEEIELYQSQSYSYRPGRGYQMAAT